MDEPESWRWLWLGAAVLFGLGEIASPGSFFLAPFAIGAAVAAVLAFGDVSVLLEWTAFVGVSVACLLALRPLARRLDQAGLTEGFGSRRLIGRVGLVVEPISLDVLGRVRVEHEEWQAMSSEGQPVEAGRRVLVTAVEGTKVVVIEAKEPQA